MSNKLTDDQIKRRVSSEIHDLLRDIGLLEMACPTPRCRTQIFSTWEIDVTCNRCGEQVQLTYDLEQSWLK